MPNATSKSTILHAALVMAGRDGLEGITIGRLASKLDVSKSGVIGQFKSKENLQVEVVKYAAVLFNAQVVMPNRGLTPGLPRLRGMLESWQRYASGQTGFSDGCFFVALAAEYDARPGAVCDLVKHLGASWFRAIKGEVTSAIDAGQLPDDTNTQQLAFEIHALLLQANWALQLFGDTESMQNMQTALARLLSPNSQFHSAIN